jgi:hypothetical protein
MTVKRTVRLLRENVMVFLLRCGTRERNSAWMPRGTSLGPPRMSQKRPNGLELSGQGIPLCCFSSTPIIQPHLHYAPFPWSAAASCWADASLPSFRPCRSALTLGKPIAISSGTSKAAPRICMRTRLTFVVIGTGWMGIFLGHVETS